MRQKMRVKFSELAGWLQDYYGLKLEKCDPDSRGRFSSEWKTGWMISGSFPGYKHGWQHYPTLKSVAEATGFFIHKRSEER